MPVVFLHPTSFIDPGGNVTSGLVTDVDELVSAADGDLQVGNTNQWSGADSTVQFVMEDLPGDAVGINSVILRVRAMMINHDNDISTWTWDVNGSNLSGNVSWNQNSPDGSLQNKISILTGSPSVADVNAAQIRVDQTTWTQTMGPDNMHHDWDCLEFEVDYDKPAAFEHFLRRTNVLLRM